MKRFAKLTLAVMSLTIPSATACGHPLIPIAVVHAKASANESKMAVPGRPGSSVSTIHAWPVQRFIVRRTKPIMGVDLYALSNYSAARVTADGLRTLSYIKNFLHANAVGIVWNFYDTTYSSNVVRTTSKTLSAKNVAILVKIARRLGLRVELRPLIMVTGEPNPWQGKIVPASSAKWFASYFAAEKPYLLLAQKLGVREFVTANEMHHMNADPLWPSFFRRVRGVYHGIVSYTAWDLDYLPDAARVLPVRYLGTNMYRPLFLPDSAPLRQVTAAWEAYFRHVPASVMVRTAVDETGIAARHGAYRHPGDMWKNVGRDEQVQVNWYLAACHTVLHYHMRGVYFWKIDLTDNPAHPARSLSTFEGQKGALAIRACAKLIDAAA